jgi:DNA adenine methylase
MSKPTRPPLRYHGGKWRAADKIIPLLPPHMTYVEPFGGGGSILLRKNRSVHEVYNDLDGDIVNVFRVLQHEEESKRLISLLELTPFSRDEFKIAYEKTECQVEQARRTIIRSMMGFSSSGATKSSTGFRSLDRVDGRSNSAAQWNSLPDYLHLVTKRLGGVIIENEPAIDLIKRLDNKKALHYVDPPYLPDTRSSMKTGSTYYRHEMTEDDHIELIQLLQTVEGKVLLSGYNSDLYNDTLSDWEKVQFPSRAASARGTVLRNECVWIKPGSQNGLFA